MEEKNLILTSDNFFDSVEFQKRSEIEQVSYILFYVTEVAHLRKDMIPDIIADRIHDQYESFFQRNPSASKASYCPIKAERIKSILDKNPEWFQKVNSGIFSGSDRGPKMKIAPYVLTQRRKEELWEKFDKDIKSRISLQSKRLFMDRTISTLLVFSLLFLSIVFAFTQFIVKDNEIVVTSVKDYVHRVNFEDYSPTKKSVLFVYYVTKLTEMRKVVNANAIHDRIVELDYEMPPQEELNKLLDNSDYLEGNNGSPKAYHLSAQGAEFAENIVYSHIKDQNGINITWDKILAIITILGPVIVSLMKAAYSLGKKQ